MNALPPIVSSSAQSAGPDLFVDLDGTLFAGDIAEESLARALRNWSAARAAATAYAQAGLSGLKRSLAQTMPPDVTRLPYREDVLSYIRDARAAGRKVVLATAADKAIAQDVADHLGLFDAVIASEPGRNLKGRAKLAAIRDMAQGPFEYLGDSDADIPIWQEAAMSGYVTPSTAATRHMKASSENVTLHVQPDVTPAKALIKAMRPHQWAKNVLVFVPILFAHAYTDASVLLAGLLAFLCFSFCASGVYLINDIIDIEADVEYVLVHRRLLGSRGKVEAPTF